MDLLVVLVVRPIAEASATPSRGAGSIRRPYIDSSLLTEVLHKAPMLLLYDSCQTNRRSPRMTCVFRGDIDHCSLPCHFLRLWRHSPVALRARISANVMQSLLCVAFTTTSFRATELSGLPCVDRVSARV